MTLVIRSSSASFFIIYLLLGLTGHVSNAWIDVSATSHISTPRYFSTTLGTTSGSGIRDRTKNRLYLAQNDNHGSSKEQQQRLPWDFFRFLKQSSRFLSMFPTTFSSSTTLERRGKIPPGTVLWKAGNNADNDFEFAPLDDVVMGGASSSNFDKVTGKWSGTVTDANNGGFVGIRSTPFVKYDLSECTGIEWTLAGTATDLRLKVVLRDSTEFNGIGWTSSRDTTAKGGKALVTTLKIKFDEQLPTRFAKVVPNQPPFNRASLKAFQLVYSKFEYDGVLNPKFQVGDFEIQLLEIRSY